MDNADKVIEYIKQKGQASIGELPNYLGISRRSVERLLNQLTASGQLVKSGKHPEIKYCLAQSSNVSNGGSNLPAPPLAGPATRSTPNSSFKIFI